MLHCFVYLILLCLCSRDTDEMKTSYEEIEREAIGIQGQFASTKKELQEKRDEAFSVAPLEDANGNDLPLKAELEALEVTDLHDLDAALEEAEAKANAIDANPNFLRRYQEQKEKMVEIEERLEDATNSKEAKAAAIETKQAQWESALEENVAKINVKFERYMADMGFTGAVRLTKGASVDDASKRGPFSTWGIEIRVSFRDGHLPQVLSAHAQSGGERSVSTIMYLMALQDMMTAPFRCVGKLQELLFVIR
jgi:structural maintenance of chromosomes protein 5